MNQVTPLPQGERIKVRVKKGNSYAFKVEAFLVLFFPRHNGV